MSTPLEQSLFPAFLDGVATADRFSCWLRIHRDRLGLTCEAMSLCSGLDAGTWAALENCEILDPSAAVLLQVAAALETSVGQLMMAALLSAGARRYGLS